MTQITLEKYFLIQEKGSLLEIKLETEELTKEIENKLIELLHTAYFAIRHDLQINLEDISHVPPSTLFLLLDFAKEMQKECRKTSLINAPLSTQFFIFRFEFQSLLQVL